MPAARTQAIDINYDLVAYVSKNDFASIQANLIELPFGNDEIGVIHCSHVIEYLAYP